MPSIRSCLAPEKRGIKRSIFAVFHFYDIADIYPRALLEAIATRLVSSRAAVDEYVRCTLLYQSMDEDKLCSMTEAALQDLLEADMVCLKDDASYESTQLGQAIVASSFSPEDGGFVHGELKRALQAFVMDGEMHVFYMFTPLQMGATEIDWPTFRDEMDGLDESGIRALQFVGVKPSFVNAMYGTDHGFLRQFLIL